MSSCTAPRMEEDTGTSSEASKDGFAVHHGGHVIPAGAGGFGEGIVKIVDSGGAPGAAAVETGGPVSAVRDAPSMDTALPAGWTTWTFAVANLMRSLYRISSARRTIATKGKMNKAGTKIKSKVSDSLFSEPCANASTLPSSPASSEAVSLPAGPCTNASSSSSPASSRAVSLPAGPCTKASSSSSPAASRAGWLPAGPCANASSSSSPSSSTSVFGGASSDRNLTTAKFSMLPLNVSSSSPPTTASATSNQSPVKAQKSPGGNDGAPQPALSPLVPGSPSTVTWTRSGETAAKNTWKSPSYRSSCRLVLRAMRPGSRTSRTNLPSSSKKRRSPKGASESPVDSAMCR
mmetsp:Transcript_3068/g.8678  ORF Transcript_3068/g.8678 Transcript_3068/m.8678 type:complete len:348 (+) Transcript_3068:771-1814(+)